MALQQLRNCNFGRSKLNATGSSGVGYQLLDVTGSLVGTRVTSGVYQTAPGIYAAYVSFPDSFRGQILWDTGTAFAKVYYSTEQYNVEENDPRTGEILDKLSAVSGSIEQIGSKTDRLIDIQYGRWKIYDNQMIFYAEDNITEVARFNLFDENGVPTVDAVFDRVRV